MENNSKQLDRVKRIKFFEEFLLAGGGKEGVNGKIIAKSLKDKKHITIKFTRDYIDIHETEEGKVKKYKSIAKIKLEDFIENLESFVKHFKVEFPKFRIDLDDSKYQEYIALIPRSNDTLKNELFRRKGRDLLMSRKILEDPKLLNKIYIPSRLPEIEKYDFEWARVYSPKEKRWLVLFRLDNNYFLIEDELLEKWLNKLSPF